MSHSNQRVDGRLGAEVVRQVAPRPALCVRSQPDRWIPTQNLASPPNQPKEIGCRERQRTKLPNEPIFPPNPNKNQPLVPLATEAIPRPPMCSPRHPQRLRGEVIPSSHGSPAYTRSEEHTSKLQSLRHLVC